MMTIVDVDFDLKDSVSSPRRLMNSLDGLFISESYRAVEKLLSRDDSSRTLVYEHNLGVRVKYISTLGDIKANVNVSILKDYGTPEARELIAAEIRDAVEL